MWSEVFRVPSRGCILRQSKDIYVIKGLQSRFTRMHPETVQGYVPDQRASEFLHEDAPWDSPMVCTWSEGFRVPSQGCILRQSNGMYLIRGLQSSFTRMHPETVQGYLCDQRASEFLHKDASWDSPRVSMWSEGFRVPSQGCILRQSNGMYLIRELQSSFTRMHPETVQGYLCDQRASEFLHKDASWDSPRVCTWSESFRVPSWGCTLRQSKGMYLIRGLQSSFTRMHPETVQWYVPDQRASEFLHKDASWDSPRVSMWSEGFRVPSQGCILRQSKGIYVIRGLLQCPFTRMHPETVQGYVPDQRASEFLHEDAPWDSPRVCTWSEGFRVPSRGCILRQSKGIYVIRGLQSSFTRMHPETVQGYLCDQRSLESFSRGSTMRWFKGNYSIFHDFLT